MNVAFDFHDRAVLVTGASKGIGRGIATAFGQAGATVGVNYRTDEAGAREVAAEIEAAGGAAVLLPADVSDPEAVAGMFAEFDARVGKLNFLINNAGQGGPGKLLHELTPAEWRALLGTNLDGPFYCAAEAARRLIAAGNGGRIVNITSVHEEACNVEGGGPYSASKGGLRNLTRTLALELGPHGITVNALAPGMILTPMNQRALDDAAYREFASSVIPTRRPGLPADIAGMALYLCSDMASYCTGQTTFVDGGWLLKWPPV